MLMKQVWSKEEPKSIDNTVIDSLLCLIGSLRSGKVRVPSEAAHDSSVHLNIGDVALDSIEIPFTIRLTIKASKSDHFRKR